MMDLVIAVGIYLAAAAATAFATYLYFGQYWDEYLDEKRRDRGDSKS